MTTGLQTLAGGIPADRCTDARLYELLGIGKHDLVSFTGGGGKTSLMFHLCGELSRDGHRTLVTTTTKMYYPYGFGGEIVIDGDVGRIAQAAAGGGRDAVFAAARTNGEGKVVGFDPRDVDALYERLPSWVVLNEADGAAMKPYKFYRDGEPVLPETTLIVHVVGCEVLGRPMDGSLFHRCPSEMVGMKFDEHVFDQLMRWYVDVRIADRDCRKVLVVNKADEGREAAAEFMREIGARYFDACLVASLKNGRWHV